MSAQEYETLSRRIEDLRAFEREYRLHLRLYLEDCLAAVQGDDEHLPLRASGRRLGEASDADLREVLADLSEGQRHRIMTALLRIPVPEVTQ